MRLQFQHKNISFDNPTEKNVANRVDVMELTITFSKLINEYICVFQYTHTHVMHLYNIDKNV